MKEFCENSLCKHPGVKAVPVSVDGPSDQTRTLCAACEEVYSWGVQHGTTTTRAETDLPQVAASLAGGFVVLAKNATDPSSSGRLEAWAYAGPLNFEAAQPVTFGVGGSILEALSALDGQLTRVGAGDNRPMVHPIWVGNRELATILAALRFHQEKNLQAGEGIPDCSIKDIATDGGRLRALTFDEVERLCRCLNTGGRKVEPRGRPGKPLHVVLSVSGGVADVIFKPRGVVVSIYDYDLDGACEADLPYDPDGRCCSIAQWETGELVTSHEHWPIIKGSARHVGPCGPQ